MMAVMSIGKVLFVLILLKGAESVRDRTTCMTDQEEGDRLHFVCFCDTPYLDVASHAKFISRDPGFSLAHFAFNLAGSYFGKSVHVTFRSCKHLKVVLDHMELSRIGSDYFRPDIQVTGLHIEQVYHLELARYVPQLQQRDDLQEYLIAFQSESLDIVLHAVAIVKLDSGAQFSSLHTDVDSAVRLYIDLNHGEGGDEDNLHIKGFRQSNIFFITDTKKVRLKEGESFRDRMKELSVDMEMRSTWLSFALAIFAITIFVGILGLAAVVSHRQKRKRQLKALLRAKNLGPILESKEIAQSVGEKCLPTKYTQVNNKHSRSVTPNPDIDHVLKSKSKTSKRLDINDLISGIMVRVRKGEYTTSSTDEYTKPAETVMAEPTLPEVAEVTRLPETSFYYKESSLSVSSKDQYETKNESVQVDVHVSSRNATRAHSRMEPHPEDDTDDSSYASRISQQVLWTNKANYDKPNIKAKVATFFSSVSRYRENNSNKNTKL